MNNFRSILFSLILALMVQPSFAAPACKEIFKVENVRSSSLSPTIQDAEHSKLFRSFKDIKTSFWGLVGKLPDERRKSLTHLMDSVEFFDWQHMAPKLIDNFIGNNRKSLDFTNTYDKSESRAGQAFLNHVAAREYIRANQPLLSVDSLMQFHRLLMKGGVAGLSVEALGQFRDVPIIGNVTKDWPLLSEQKLFVEENIYLSFEQSATNTVQASGIQSQVWTTQKGVTVSPKTQNVLYGQIRYPTLFKAKDALIETLKSTHPELYGKILALRTENQSKNNPNTRPPTEIERQFIQALTENRFKRFLTEKSELGTIEIGRNESAYIDLVADFMRDLIAIHPFRDGNGRTLRLLANYLLTSEGLPYSRVVDPFQDIQISPIEWRRDFHLGVINTVKLYKELDFRVRNGLTPEYAAELLFPGLPHLVKIRLQRESSSANSSESALAKLYSSQFTPFLKTLLKYDPNLKTDLSSNVLQTMSAIAELFVDFYRSKTIRYIHSKDGEREISLRFVEPDFIDIFGRTRAYNRKLYEDKIGRWYDKQMLLWRGLSNKSRELTNEELIGYFKQPSAHLASNRVVNKIRNGANIVESMKQDFETYNQDLLNGDIIEMAIDHHTTGPKYADSYGYSTSKREIVGKAFAMGAMVVGKYGEHTDPQLQALLKSRINIASYRARKDVDLTRLRQFTPDFSYQYPRQAEIMGIGGTDPDAVMIIQRIDAKGNVTETFLRSEEDPNIVLLIKGRFVPGEGDVLTPDRILEQFQLFDPTVEAKNNTPQSNPASRRTFMQKFKDFWKEE